MHVEPIKTRIFNPPKDDLFKIFKSAIRSIPEKSILAVTSKVVSIAEGRCVSGNGIGKEDLIKREAEYYLPRVHVPGEFVTHTIKNNLVVASAGIDASNAAGYYILWPKDSYASARTIHAWIQKTYGVSDVGVLITDSHSIPFRRGVIGSALGYYGFLPLKDYRGKKDIFGRELIMTMTNIPDSLAVSAVVVMGEGNETTPVSLITDVPWITFYNGPQSSKDLYSSFEVPMEEDTFAPFFKDVPWEKGDGGIVFSG